jgi:phenylpropionate dioxygenase-like ring-hydroxylating dioxygenase large terminal subunit
MRPSAGRLTPDPQGVGGFDQCWYPIAMSSEVPPGSVFGQEFLDGRVVAYRGVSGRVSVLSAYCRHMGSDLVDGEVVGDNLQCPFHHWCYDAGGSCVGTEVGDRVPKDTSLFAFPTEERWGLIWAFNGREPTYPLPGWDRSESDRHVRVVQYPDFRGDPFMLGINAIDVQHIRSLHGWDITDVLVVPGDNSFHADMTLGSEARGVAPMSRHAALVGSNAVVYSDTSTGIDTFAAGTPYRGRTRAYMITGGLRDRLPADRIDELVAAREQVSVDAIAEDLPVLEHIRFKGDTFTASDRGIVAFLQWVVKYPRAHPAQAFMR